MFALVGTQRNDLRREWLSSLAGDFWKRKILTYAPDAVLIQSENVYTPLYMYSGPYIIKPSIQPEKKNVVLD